MDRGIRKLYDDSSVKGKKKRGGRGNHKRGLTLAWEGLKGDFLLPRTKSHIAPNTVGTLAI